MKIVCVDDEILVLGLTVSMCERLPQEPEVEGFENVEDTLAYFESNTADIAILDINMPEMNGFALAARIREKHPDISIIFITGYADYSEDILHLYASDCLLKPVSADRLAEAVENAIEGSRKTKVN